MGRINEVKRGILQQRRKERGLSSRETYQSLQKLSGPELLQAPPVADLLTYAADWDPFIVNKNPSVKPNDYPHAIPLNGLSGEIALPHPFIVPSRKEGKDQQWGEQQFYWDMYFINKALLISQKPEYIQLAINHVENFQFIFDRLNYIPNATQEAIINRTQIPFLTGMIRDIYQITGDKEWLRKKMEFAKREYEDVWMLTREEKLQRGIRRPSHRIDGITSLIRPVGTDIVEEHYVAAAATGQDDSTQWAGRAYEKLPVALNAALWKYESDFAFAAHELGDGKEEEKWSHKADVRKADINLFFWDKKRGMYFDAIYDRKTKSWEQDKDYYGLTGFMPLWVGLASQEQANAVMKNLHKFESPYGLMMASRDSRPIDWLMKLRMNMAFGLGKASRRFIPAMEDVAKQKQWDYPNIWAPYEYFAIDGMLRYGKEKDANRVMGNILRSLASFYQEHGTLPEKIDGNTGQNGKNFQYPDQEGFGWTNALVDLIPSRLSSEPNPLHSVVQLRRHESRFSSSSRFFS